MSDRLLGISPRLAAAGLVGLVAALALYRAGLGAQVPDFPVGEPEIRRAAAAFAEARGVPAAEAESAETRRNDRDDLNVAIGIEAARRASLADELPVATWVVRVRSSAPKSADDAPRSGSVTLSETGKVIAAAFDEPGAERPAPARDEARAVAVEALRDLGVALDGFAERASSDKDEMSVTVSAGDKGLLVDAKPADPSAGSGAPDSGSPVAETNPDSFGPPEARKPADESAAAAAPEAPTKQKFVWERPDPAHPGVTQTVTATVTATGMPSFAREISYASEPEARNDVATLVQNVALAFFIFFLVLLLLALAVFRLAAKDYVRRRRALMVWGLTAVGGALAYAVMFGTIGWSGLLKLLGIGLVAALCGIPVACAWLIGEADAYTAWGKRVTEGALAAMTGRPLARQVARETLEGYFWGWTLLGAFAVVAAVVVAAAGPDAVHQPAELLVADARVGWLFWLASVPYALGASVVGYLFLTSWLHRVLKRAWLAAPVTVVCVAFVLQCVKVIYLSFGPLPAIVSWALPLSAAMYFVTTRRGWMTAAVATFAFSAFYFGIPGLVVGTLAEHAAAAGGLALVAVPPTLAFAFGRALPEVMVREVPPPRINAMIERARREEELNIAHRVQSGLLPAADPSFVGFDVSGMCRPASEVGGDYFDYFKLPDGRFGIAVGDVSGKGVPAAFFMTMTKGFMEVAAAEAGDPAAVLGFANGHLRGLMAKNTFVTMTYAVLDPESRVVTCARAGHNPPVYVAAGAEPTLVNPPGTALGAAAPESFGRLLGEHTLELRRGDALVFYTDGVTEAMNAAREQFGEERLLRALDEHRGGDLTARALVDRLVGEIDAFSGGADQHDDITLVVVKVA